MHISSNSSRPLPSTESASETIGDPFETIPWRLFRRSVSGKARRSVPLSHRIVEGHVAGGPCAAEKLVELRSARPVSRDHLTVEYGFRSKIEQPANLVAERLETAQEVAVARDEAATALLDVAQPSYAELLQREAQPPQQGMRTAQPGKAKVNRADKEPGPAPGSFFCGRSADEPRLQQPHRRRPHERALLGRRISSPVMAASGITGQCSVRKPR